MTCKAPCSCEFITILQERIDSKDKEIEELKAQGYAMRSAINDLLNGHIHPNMQSKYEALFKEIPEEHRKAISQFISEENTAVRKLLYEQAERIEEHYKRYGIESAHRLNNPWER